MITIAPHPSVTSILTGFGIASVQGGEVDLKWTGGSARAVWYSRSTVGLWQLAAWFAKTRGRPPVVWVPDYFCNEALLPLRDLGVSLVFYRLLETLDPDWGLWASLLNKRAPDFVLLVHYFGREGNGARAAEFCRSVNALLIEDATHVLRPSGAIGRNGAITLYSPYKVLAVPDGGLMCIGGGVFGEALASSSLPSAGLGPYVWLVRRIVQKFLPKFVIHRLQVRAARPMAEDPQPHLAPARRLSAVAHRMIARASLLLDDLARARKANADMLRAIDWPAGVRPFFSRSNEGEAPYRFVLHCDDEEIAAILYERLLACGCAVETWPDMPPEVRLAPEEHGAALALRNCLLFLPVHQSLDRDELREAYGAAIRA